MSFHLPRSVLLALWWSARPDEVPGPGPEPVADWARRAVRVVEGQDERHGVRTVTGSEPSLREYLVALAPASGGGAAVLPAPGSPGPVPAPAAAAAITAGECVLLDLSSGSRALVPRVFRFGTDLEPGHRVVWEEFVIPPWRTAFAAEVGALAEAERAVRATLGAVAGALESLDVARAGPGLSEALAAVRQPALLGGSLPPTVDARRAALLALGSRLGTVVTVAARDDGAAVTGAEADRRRTALRDLDAAARRAVAAATAVPGRPDSGTQSTER